jgi:hypothetical protein
MLDPPPGGARCGGGGGAVFYAELDEGSLEEGFYRVLTQAEDFGDLLVAFSFFHPLEDFDFALAQGGEGIGGCGGGDDHQAVAAELQVAVDGEFQDLVSYAVAKGGDAGFQGAGVQNADAGFDPFQHGIRKTGSMREESGEGAVAFRRVEGLRAAVIIQGNENRAGA